MNLKSLVYVTQEKAPTISLLFPALADLSTVKQWSQKWVWLLALTPQIGEDFYYDLRYSYSLNPKQSEAL